MKKLVFIFLFFILFSLPVSATKGDVKKNSVIFCDGEYYGAHSNPLHWHIIEKKDDKWVLKNEEIVEAPSCLSNNRIVVTFNKCVDGDTIKLKIDGKKERVRLLAIDTPESVTPDKPVEAYGKEASNYTCNLVKNANRIEIEYDINSDKEDKFGRVLAYVYVDGKMLQEELLKKGLAKVAYLYGNYQYTEKFKELEKEAKEKKLGLWNLDDPNYEIIDEEQDNKKELTFFEKIINFFKKIFNYIKELF